MRAARSFKPNRPPALVLGDLTLVRPLVIGGVEVVLATSEPDDPSLSSRHPSRRLLLPPLSGATESRALKALRRAGAALVAEDGSRPLLVYGSDATLEFVHRHRDALGEQFSLLLPRASLVEDTLDKQRFSRLASERGVIAPNTLSDDEPLEAAQAFGEEVVLKPRTKSSRSPRLTRLLGSAKAVVIPTGRLLTDPAIASERASFVIQRRIHFEVEDLVSFHGFADRESRVLASFVGRKLRTHPALGGDSASVDVVEDRAVADEGARVVASLGVQGPFKLDLVRERDTGRLLTFEANLRYTLWHYVGAVNGINLPLAAYRYLVDGVRVPRTHATPRVRWVNVHRDFKSSRESGEPLTSWMRSLIRGRRVYETFAWDDPLPALHWLGATLDRRWRKWCASV